MLHEDEHKDIFDEIEEAGFKEVRRKTIESYKVKYIRATHSHILDGPHDWPSMHLALVPVIGREVNLEEGDVRIGAIRYSHDPQRMVNFWMSAATEKVALVPKAPFIASADQIAGHEDQWQNMYTSNNPVLLYNSESETPPPQRVNTAAIASGEIDLIFQSRALLQDTIGMHDAALGKRSNEVSGVALESRQEASATGMFDFIDNLAKAVVRVGEILADMIPRVYTSDKARRLILADDSQLMIDLNKMVKDRQTGREFRVHTLDHARYACRVSVGPSSKTQRSEFVNLMMEWGRTDPEGLSMFRDLIVTNLDVPNAAAIAKRMKAAVPRHLLSPEDQELIPPPEPTIQDQIQQKQVEAEMMKADAEMKKADAGVRSSELRAQSDEARLKFEMERGLNREVANDEVAQVKAEKARQTEGPDIKAMIDASVKQAVARAVAERS